MNEEDKDKKLFEDVNWLYDRLNKKEMLILGRWVYANCETVKEQEKQKTAQTMIDELYKFYYGIGGDNISLHMNEKEFGIFKKNWGVK